MAGSTDAAPASEPELLQLLHCLSGPAKCNGCSNSSSFTSCLQQGVWHTDIMPLLLLLKLLVLVLHLQRRLLLITIILHLLLLLLLLSILCQRALALAAGAAAVTAQR
jgi:hypothetical protein